MFNISFNLFLWLLGLLQITVKWYKTTHHQPWTLWSGVAAWLNLTIV